MLSNASNVTHTHTHRAQTDTISYGGDIRALGMAHGAVLQARIKIRVVKSMGARTCITPSLTHTHTCTYTKYKLIYLSQVCTMSLYMYIHIYGLSIYDYCSANSKMYEMYIVGVALSECAFRSCAYLFVCVHLCICLYVCSCVFLQCIWSHVCLYKEQWLDSVQPMFACTHTLCIYIYIKVVCLWSACGA